MNDRSRLYSRLIIAGPGVVTALGFALRLFDLGTESLWYDELLQLEIAREPLLSIIPRLRGHTAVPLDYVLAHFWLWLGTQEAWVRMPAVIVGTVSLPVTYQLGRRLVGAGTGLLAMAILAVSPMHVRYSQEVRPYALVVLGLGLAGYAFWQLRQRYRWRYLALLQVGIAVSTLSHVFATAVALTFAVFSMLVLLVPKNRKTKIRPLVVLVATGVLPLALLMSMDWGDVLFHSSLGFGQALVEPELFELEPAYKPNRGAGPEPSLTFVVEEILGPLGAGQARAWLWLLNGLAGLGCIWLLLRRRFGLSLFLLLWLVLPVVLIVAFLIYRGTFFAPRYIISVLPAYVILMAAGVLAGPRWLVRRRYHWASVLALLLAGSLVFLALGSELQRLYRSQDKENWRVVGKFIRENAGPEDAVIAMKAEPVVNWYFPQAKAVPNHYDQLETIQQAVAGAGRSWVILSIYSSGGDARVKAWLGDTEQGSIRFVLDPAITVYYLGPALTREQLLEEIQEFALPVDYALYASLARENRHRPQIARQYYRLAIQYAPNEKTRADYQRAFDALP
jgi:mannosyltransferase